MSCGKCFFTYLFLIFQNVIKTMISVWCLPLVCHLLNVLNWMKQMLAGLWLHVPWHRHVYHLLVKTQNCIFHWKASVVGDLAISYRSNLKIFSFILFAFSNSILLYIHKYLLLPYITHIVPCCSNSRD